MKIELYKNDIIDELGRNYINQVDFFIEIIDHSTTTWDVYRDVAIRLLKELHMNGELSDMLEPYK